VAEAQGQLLTNGHAHKTYSSASPLLPQLASGVTPPLSRARPAAFPFGLRLARNSSLSGSAGRGTTKEGWQSSSRCARSKGKGREGGKMAVRHRRLSAATRCFSPARGEERAVRSQAPAKHRAAQLVSPCARTGSCAPYATLHIPPQVRVVALFQASAPATAAAVLCAGKSRPTGCGGAAVTSSHCHCCCCACSSSMPAA
jgi:hypothetical protein